MASDNDLGGSAIGSNRKKDPSYRKDCLDCSQKRVKKIELVRAHCYSGAICNGGGGGGGGGGEEEEEGAVTGQNTYRCYSTTLPDHAPSLDSGASRFVLSSGTTARVERRCKIDGGSDPAASQNEAARRERYIVDNRQVMRISTTSLSDPDASDCQGSCGPDDIARRVAHSEWVRRKREAAQRKREDEERATKKRQEEEAEMIRKKEEKARLERLHFLKWMEEKRQQELDRKATFQANELELQKRLKEIEDKAAVAKARYFRQWIHKKTQEQEARHKEQESRQRKMNEEREKRLEQCSKAYEKWKQSSINRPKPATQGLLSHQKAKPAYVNPIPWQSIVEIDSDGAQDNAYDDKNRDASLLKMKSGSTVVAHR